MPLRMDSRLALAPLLALVGALSTGCTLFQERLSPELTAQVTPNGVEDGKLEAPPGNFTVEVRPAKGQPIAKEQPLAGHLSVQEALEHTKADKKFGKFTLQLHRPLPDGRVHSMLLEYDRAAKHVDPEFDYAILPGDRVIVVEDTTTMFDELMDRMSLPMGKKSKSAASARYRTEG